MRAICTFFLLLLLTTSSWARVVVISDLDETLRIAHTHSYWAAIGAVISGVKPFKQMQNIFHDLEQQSDIAFFYISASYYRFYNGKKWLKKYNFPAGPVFQKPTFSQGSYDFKTARLEELFKSGRISSNDHLLLFGDNSSHDEEVYLDFLKRYNLSGDIFIRDIKVKATALDLGLQLERKDKIYYFFTEFDLLDTPIESFLSPTTRDSIIDQFLIHQGVVKSQYVYLKEKLEKVICNGYMTEQRCSDRVETQIKYGINFYFSHFPFQKE